MTLSRRSLIATTLAGSALAAGPAFAQDQAIVGIQTQTNYFIDGRIAAVDPTARTVTITGSDGTPRTLTVSPATANLAAMKVGDTVSANIEESRTFVLSGPNTRTPRPRSASVSAAVETGETVTGAGVSRSIANWWVVGVNP